MGKVLRSPLVLIALRALSFLFLPPPSLLAAPAPALPLTAASPRTFLKCHQTAQSVKRSQSYRNFSPGNFHKLKIGAVILSIEGGQRNLHRVHNPGVVPRGQQGAVGAELVHILCRVYSQREKTESGL